jgi:hypothetical protein
LFGEPLNTRIESIEYLALASLVKTLPSRVEILRFDESSNRLEASLLLPLPFAGVEFHLCGTEQLA